MAVPETTVHEYNGPESRQDDIGGSRQVAAVQAEPIAEAVEDLANCKLR